MRRGRPGHRRPSRLKRDSITAKNSLTGKDAGGRGRFVCAGLPAPRQLVLDLGKDMNEFYQMVKGGT